MTKLDVLLNDEVESVKLLLSWGPAGVHRRPPNTWNKKLYTLTLEHYVISNQGFPLVCYIVEHQRSISKYILIGKIFKNLSSAAVVIGALRVKCTVIIQTWLPSYVVTLDAYFNNSNNKWSAHLWSFICSITACICDNYQNLMDWLKLSFIENYY